MSIHMKTIKRIIPIYIFLNNFLFWSLGANEHIQECSDSRGVCKYWNWDVDASHRCNIKKMTLHELYQKFKHGLPPLYHEPIILNRENPEEEDASNCVAAKFRSMMSLENITNTFPEDFEVTLSSSNSYSAHRRTITLAKYLNETLDNEILPHQMSNLTWYLFGETYSEDWKKVLRHYCLPPCQTCTSDLR